MRKQSKAIRVVLTILAGAFVVAALTGPANTPKTAIMHPPLITPAVSSPSPSPEPTTQTGIQPPEASPSAAASAATSPTTSEADRQAELILTQYWQRFTDALQRSGELTDQQLILPPIVAVQKLSGCPPGLENLLPNAIKDAVRFCDNKIHVISSAFTKLGDSGQRLGAASVFIYHAYAHVTAAQHANRTPEQVLGCIQADLSRAHDNEGDKTLPQHVWVVMSKTASLVHDDVYNSYYATMDNGEWS